MLLLTPEDTRGLITMEEAIECVEQAIREWGESAPRLNHPRHRVHSPTNARVSVHQGTVPGLGVGGLMAHCEWVRELPNGIQKFALRGRPVQVLYSAQNAELLLSRDYLSVPEDEIGQIDPVLTVVGGQIVYSQPEFANSGGLPTVGYQGDRSHWKRGVPEDAQRRRLGSGGEL